MSEPQKISDGLDDQVNEILARYGLPTGEDLAERPTDAATERIERAVAYTDGRIPARYQQAKAEAPTIIRWAAELATASRDMPSGRLAGGPSLLVLGPTGVGKTHQAYGAIRWLAGYGIAVKWLAAPAADLYAQLRPRHGLDSEEEFRRIADAPLLLVDDIAAAKATEWTEEVTYRLVNWRYERLLPTILTSNVPPSDLKAALGDRVASRLVEMCERVVLKGDDRRRTP